MGQHRGRRASRLPGDALEGTRLLDLRPHWVQIIRGGDHGEQQHENADQEQTRTQAAVTRRMSCPGWLVPPDPDRRQSQRQPEKVEQQFHVDAWNPNYINKVARETATSCFPQQRSESGRVSQ